MKDIFDIIGIQPMLIAEQVEPYDDPDSIFELKLDGLGASPILDGELNVLQKVKPIFMFRREHY